MKEDGYSISDISRLLGKDRRTIRKYISGNPNDLCKDIRKRYRYNPYENRVINLVESGYIEKQIVNILISEGYKLSISNARHMIRKVVKDNNLNINKYSPVTNSVKTSNGANDMKYTYIKIPEIASFIRGLSKDWEAIENAVLSDLSNRFVEGTNGKLKMIKRTMYGRCSKKLLSAKLMLSLNG